jgi:hypothetical protein
MQYMPIPHNKINVYILKLNTNKRRLELRNNFETDK